MLDRATRMLHAEPFCFIFELAGLCSLGEFLLVKIKQKSNKAGNEWGDVLSPISKTTQAKDTTRHPWSQ